MIIAPSFEIGWSRTSLGTRAIAKFRWSSSTDEVWNVIDGQLEITIAGETQVAGAGCAAIIPPDAAHSVKALTDVRVIVVDYPRRDSIGDIAL